MVNTRKNVSRAASDAVVISCEVDCGDISDESRKIVELLSSKLEGAVSELKAILELKDSKINKLESELASMKREWQDLREKVEDIENFQRRDSLVISGEGIPAAAPAERTTEVVRAVVRSHLKVELGDGDVLEAYRTGLRGTQDPGRGQIVVKLRHHSLREDLVRTSKTVRPANVFINENLTPMRSKILYTLRQAKRRFPDKINGCGSRNGQVYAWIKPPNPSAKNMKVLINSINRLEEFCVKTLNVQSCQLTNRQAN